MVKLVKQEKWRTIEDDNEKQLQSFQNTLRRMRIMLMNMTPNDLKDFQKRFDKEILFLDVILEASEMSDEELTRLVGE